MSTESNVGICFSIRSLASIWELWVEKNSAATPRRLAVTHRLLPGQPSFIAEFTSWNTKARPSESEFAFQPPAGAKKIELTAAAAPATKRTQ